ncbi:MAG: phosphoglycerate dehydrogenase [Chloroflexi bacterium]|nr:phosphoglycerate dehydrogenase [Chloroflexota bacterium]MCY3938499.1 phosphoglycerate dehydrogenase [Chloroflexota bacterium]
MKTVVPDDHPPVFQGSKAETMLRGLGEVMIFNTRPRTDDELIQRICGAEAVISIRGAVAYPREVIEACRELRIISIWGTGTDHVDLPAARELGVTVCNTPAVSAVSVAEQSLALMLAAARRLPDISAEVKEGGWPKAMISQLHGKTLGIVGLGAIGRQVARLGAGIGMNVIAWTFNPDSGLADELGVKLVELDELLCRADVVSLHVRQSPETEGMLDAAKLALMKPEAILVNTARGALIDEQALVMALNGGALGAAALDVFVEEPLPADHPLLSAPNTVLTPHSAGLSPEALEAGLVMSVENIWHFMDGSPVNLVG